MKISAINTNYQQAYKTNNTVNHNNSKPSFGFGLDYGDDDYLIANDYEYKEGSGNIFEFFHLLGQLACALFKENFRSGKYLFSDDVTLKTPSARYVVKPSQEKETQIAENIDNTEDDTENKKNKPINYLDFMDDDEWF